jgi:tetratricopeptide (TPR) repeat protein
VDTQTRHALKQDALVNATSSGIGWLEENRGNLLRIGIPVIVAVIAIVVGIVLYNQRSAQAQIALGQAMTTYNSPLRQPGAPADPGQQSFTSIADRAKAANQQFVDVEKKYGWLSAGVTARYFAGLTDLDTGQTGAAETELKKVADSSNGNLAALGKFALAGLYRGQGKDAQAIDLYNRIIAKPTDTIPAATAQLALAEVYEAENKPDEAKKIYAKLKDTDKDSAAGQIASQKLENPQAGLTPKGARRR